MFNRGESAPPFYMTRGELEVTDRILSDIKTKKIKIGYTPPFRFVNRYAATRLQSVIAEISSEGEDEGDIYRVRIEGRKKGMLKYLTTFSDAGLDHYEPIVNSGEIPEQETSAIRNNEELNILRGLSQALHER